MTKVKRISDDIHQQVLGYKPSAIPRKALQDMTKTWEAFDLQDAVDKNEAVNLPLPSWLKDFKVTAEEAVEMFGKDALRRLSSFAKMDLPALPKMRPPVLPGWLYYSTESRSWEESPTPRSKTAMVLDFETVEVNGQWYPICCAVLTDKLWYIWQADLEDLKPTIDFYGDQVIVGHNVGYDRSFLASEYNLEPSGNYFFDTMAAWIASRGFTNQQRTVYNQSLKDDYLAPGWVNETARNNLAAVYNFYTGKELDKDTRDGIVKLGLPWVRQNLGDVIWYCLKDVLSTFEVYSHVYPELRQNQPSDISMTAQLMLGNTWLPLSADRWDSYYDKAEAKTKAIQDAVEARLAQVAREVLNNPTEAQLNSTVLDWTLAKTGKAKGLPKWFRDCKGKPSMNSRHAAVLLGCTWRSETVQWDDDKGWYTDAYGAIPHPEKRGKKLTDLFMQKMVVHVESGVLDAPGGIRELLLDLVSTINWVSLRKRVAAVKTESPDGFPVVLPRLVVTGTVTRRCADNTWQVASNPKESRIGTELKSMIEAPKGYAFVGADVDSQELWLASALGDSTTGYCGSTPLGLMVLIGDKKAGTDPHSVVGKQVGVSRDISKNNLVYAAMYGQGFRGTLDGLLRNLPNNTEEECKNKANTFLGIFKGKKSQYTGKHIDGLASEAFNVMESIADQACPKTPILGAKMTSALRGSREFKTTRVNWTIQSSGVDFRDLYVVYLAYFFKKLKIDGRLMITIHDEIRTMVKTEHTKRAVYAVQLAHLLTRAYIIDALGLDCIPAGCAWHSAVDVDTVLRKDPTAPQITPSQPDAIPAGYEVTPKDMLSWWQQEDGKVA